MNRKIIIGALVVCLLTVVAVFAFSQSSQNVRWEYTLGSTSTSGLYTPWNELGAQGWEAFAAQGNVIYFKRRLP